MKARPAAVSFFVHTAAVFALIHLGAVQQIPRKAPVVDLTGATIIYHPERPVEHSGGGGARQSSPPSLGVPPRSTPRPLVPPTTRTSDHEPELPAPPAITGPDTATLVPPGPIGDPQGIPGPPSDGPGKGPGIGSGRGKYGVGDGDDSSMRGRKAVTGITTQAVLVYKIEPEFTDEARKARVQGVVVLWAEIDEDGRPVNITVRQGLGLGLDERAVEAVSRWRFRPALKNGKPVRAPALIEVSFHLL